MATSGDFFVGDELDELFSIIDGGFLENEDTISSHLDHVTTEVAASESTSACFRCEQCEKVCKSQRGLTRHINAKHPAPDVFPDQSTPNFTPKTTESTLETSLKKLHPIKLMDIVRKAASKIAADKCFPQSLRSKFSSENFSFSNNDAQKLWEKLRPIIDSFNNDAEKYFSDFFALFIENLLPEKFENFTTTNTLMSEVATDVLEHLKSEGKSATESMVITAAAISENELKSLQYLAGFVIHKLHSKFFFSRKTCNTVHSQYCLILQACKVDFDDSQVLINVRDRGGLWRVSKKIQTLFVECEVIFRSKTSNFQYQLSCQDLVNTAMKNITVISYFNSVVLTVDCLIKKELRMNLLEHILTLFFRVRSFSFAKDVREKHKRAKKESRKRSQRTELNRSTGEPS